MKCWGFGVNWRNFSDADYLEAAEHSFAVGDDANVRWDCDLDVRHDAANLNLRCSCSDMCGGEIELDVAHECERSEDPGQYPFTVAFDVRPPDRDAVASGDEIIGDDAGDAVPCQISAPA